MLGVEILHSRSACGRKKDIRVHAPFQFIMIFIPKVERSHSFLAFAKSGGEFKCLFPAQVVVAVQLSKIGVSFLVCLCTNSESGAGVTS